MGSYADIDHVENYLRVSWDLCPNIREICGDRELETCEVRAIFNTPKLRLKKVFLNFYDFDAMDVFATGEVSTLECAQFWCGFPPEDLFTSLVTNNKSLRNVKVTMCRDIPEDLGENSTLERVDK